MLEKRARRRWGHRRSTDSSPAEGSGAPPPAPAEPPIAELEGWGPLPPDGAPRASRATYVGRAPVFDRHLHVAGFALIVDEMADAPEQHGRQLLTRALLEVGLDSLIGGRIGFVEMSVDLLADGLHHALPATRMVIEVTGRIDREAEELLRHVRHEGYRLMVGSLDDCQRPGDALVVAGGVRVDARQGRLADAGRLVARRHPQAKVLVDHLADPEQVEPCLEVGATWLRGDILRPVERIDEPTVASGRLAVLELLAELERDDVGIDDIDRLVSVDVGMSYKLLRMANSSYLALERRVERTRDAIVYLGIDTVRAVAALLALSEASDRPPEIVHLSLLRAKHCQEILEVTSPSLAHAGFTTGLFSGLDLLLGLSIDQVLHRIPVSDDIAEALRSRRGRLGRVLDAVMAYERYDLDAMAAAGIDPDDVLLGYRRALNWVARVTDSLEV